MVVIVVLQTKVFMAAAEQSIFMLNDNTSFSMLQLKQKMNHKVS